jgi:23S rRNA pseudouridine1911/1915/1917 synthase
MQTQVTMAERYTREAQIPHELAGSRLDQALARIFTDYSRTLLKTWILQGRLLVNNRQPRPRDVVVGGEQVILRVEPEPAIRWQPQALSMDILYQDQDLIVINKPAGWVVHPGAGNREGTLLNALLHHDPNLAALPRAGIVHRLDKDTSGLLVIARSLRAHTELVKQLQNRTLEREYQALVQGVMVAGGQVNAPLGRHPLHRTRRAVVTRGKEAVTHYRIIHRFRAHTELQLKLETGRTHQIRVHMAYLRHPLVGDPIYGGRLHIPAGASPALAQALRGFKRQALHASRLRLLHPVTEMTLEYSVPLPQDMDTLLKILAQHSNHD